MTTSAVLSLRCVSHPILEHLVASPRAPLRDIATGGVPRTTGIYALWHDTELLYVGISKRDPADTDNPQAAGLYGRLNTYRRARLTTEVAIGATLRYVVPHLTPDQLAGLEAGRLRMRDVQTITRQWISDHITYSAVACPAADAASAEREALRIGLPGAGRPAFNGIA